MGLVSPGPRRPAIGRHCDERLREKPCRVISVPLRVELAVITMQVVGVGHVGARASRERLGTVRRLQDRDPDPAGPGALL